MITGFLITIIFDFIWLITWPIRYTMNFIPSADLLTSIGNSLPYWNELNRYLPLQTFSTVIFAIIGLEILLGTYKLIMWIIHRVPGQ